MLASIRNLPLSVQVIGSVAIVLFAVGAGNLAYEMQRESAAITDQAKKRGDAALDMLEAVHVNAMLNRDKVADGDPAIATLDGTMEQFSKQSRGVQLWLVMGPKVAAFQTAAGEEMEGPKDAIDENTISQKQPQLVMSETSMRITRPVILGQGTASDALCASCHTAKMHIEQGEVVGVYSAAVDLGPQLSDASANIRNKAAFGGIVLLLALGLITVLLRATAIKPLRRLARATEDLANGNVDAVAETGGEKRADEIGAMARSLAVFREAALANRRLQAEAETIRKRSESERLEAQQHAEREAEARLKLATAGLAAGLHRLAEGDLAFQLTEPFAPDFEGLRQDFNTSVQQLGETMAMIRQSVGVIDTGTRDIAASTGDLARRTEQQAASLEQTTSAVEQISSNISSSGHLTDEVRTSASVANVDATKSGAVVADAEIAMQRIEESSGKISNIIGVIDEIAFQTNLLALNAGVEAARAGDAGKGFAVVAQEVRELAQRSASAAKEIKGLIQNSSLEVGNGVRLVRGAGDALKTIGGHIAAINERMDSIATAAREQATGLREVSTAVNQMDQMTHQNAGMVEQSNAASASLAAETTKLRQLVEQFRLNDAVAQWSAQPSASHPASPEAARRPAQAIRPVRGNLAIKTDGWENF